MLEQVAAGNEDTDQSPMFKIVSARAPVEGDDEFSTTEGGGIFGPRALNKTQTDLQKIMTESDYAQPIDDPYKMLAQHAELLGVSKHETLSIMQKAMKDPVRLQQYAAEQRRLEAIE